MTQFHLQLAKKMLITIEERAGKLISCSFIQNVGEQNQILKYYQNESE